MTQPKHPLSQGIDGALVVEKFARPVTHAR